MNSPTDVVSENIGATSELPLKIKSNAVYSLKPATAVETNSKYVLGEIRWIGVVTLLVIVVLIVLYIFLR